MEKQMSFAASEWAGKKKQTKREKFLGQMEEMVPWSRLVGLIKPHYPKGKRGRPPMGIERMLRVYFLQQWYGLADEALEDAIYDSQAMRLFVGIDLSQEGVPDATTLLKFRHLLERHDLTRGIFEEITTMLSEQKCLMKEGTIVDATIIAAPSSTKNQSRQRDPQMHQTKKGNQWHFGMKAHVAVDAQSGLVQKVIGTAANVSDISQAHELLQGQEQDVFADAGYQGVQKRPEISSRKAQPQWHIAAKRGKIRAMPEGKLKEAIQKFEQIKAQIRSRVEHPFHILKNSFKYRKVRYRGLAKNTAQLHTLFALANLILARRSFAQSVY
jgi:IS5 family transposase